MRNNILVKYPKNWGLDKALVRQLANRTVTSRGLETVELSLVFVGRKRARDLNIKYRQQSYIPQVLGFPLSKDRDSDGWLRLGDIVICTDKLKYEASYYNRNLTDVLAAWLEHGVDNLLI